ncbi:STAS domain-containing protein [Streptomyces sp. NPDC006326]|uniref:STAS domain-containing protein n=1 Tax=Streptomyces sp. NPDC006326 TaxID=3156752 RepID=UPI0033A26576
MAANARDTSDGRAGSRLAADLRWSGTSAVVAVSGELDHDSLRPLSDALDEVFARGADRIVVDCGGLTFCDSTGLNILLRARQRAAEAGSTVELAALRPPVARMFDVTGARSVFTVHEEVPPALGDRPPQ